MLHRIFIIVLGFLFVSAVSAFACAGMGNMTEHNDHNANPDQRQMDQPMVNGASMSVETARNRLDNYMAERELKPQTTCSVLGNIIDRKVYLDYQGQRIYFCCAACIGTFKSDTENYFKKIHDDRVLLESVQKKCPVMGGNIDKKVYADYKGRRIYFCCPGCNEKFLADAGKYLDKI